MSQIVHIICISFQTQITENISDNQVTLRLGSARDCYASTLQRNKISRDDISQMLGHSNVLVTEHYLDGLDSESTFGINDSIL